MNYIAARRALSMAKSSVMLLKNHSKNKKTASLEFSDEDDAPLVASANNPSDKAAGKAPSSKEAPKNPKKNGGKIKLPVADKDQPTAQHTAKAKKLKLQPKLFNAGELAPVESKNAGYVGLQLGHHTADKNRKGKNCLVFYAFSDGFLTLKGDNAPMNVYLNYSGTKARGGRIDKQLVSQSSQISSELCQLANKKTRTTTVPFEVLDVSSVTASVVGLNCNERLVFVDPVPWQRHETYILAEKHELAEDVAKRMGFVRFLVNQTNPEDLKSIYIGMPVWLWEAGQDFIGKGLAKYFLGQTITAKDPDVFGSGPPKTQQKASQLISEIRAHLADTDSLSLATDKLDELSSLLAVRHSRVKNRAALKPSAPFGMSEELLNNKMGVAARGAITGMLQEKDFVRDLMARLKDAIDSSECLEENQQPGIPDKSALGCEKASGKRARATDSENTKKKKKKEHVLSSDDDDDCEEDDTDEVPRRTFAQSSSKAARRQPQKVYDTDDEDEDDDTQQEISDDDEEDKEDDEEECGKEDTDDDDSSSAPTYAHYMKSLKQFRLWEKQRRAARADSKGRQAAKKGLKTTSVARMTDYNPKNAKKHPKQSRRL